MEKKYGYLIIFIIFVVLLLFVLLYRKLKESYQPERSFFLFDEVKDILTRNISCPDKKHIPKVIYRTAPFDSNNLPREIKNNLSLMNRFNPEYTQVYFSDEDVRKFVGEEFPNYLEYYDLLIPGAFKTDFWRLLVLYRYGGVYIDIGFEPKVSLNDFIDPLTDEFVITLDKPTQELNNISALHNAFICCYPQHPFIFLCIKEIVKNIKNRFMGKTALDITGPHLLGKVFSRDILEDSDKIKITENIYIIDGNKYNFLTYLRVSIRYDDGRYTGGIYVETKEIFNTKFKDYHKVMYKNRNVEHYGILWNTNRVYSG